MLSFLVSVYIFFGVEKETTERERESSREKEIFWQVPSAAAVHAACGKTAAGVFAFWSAAVATHVQEHSSSTDIYRIEFCTLLRRFELTMSVNLIILSKKMKHF